MCCIFCLKLFCSNSYRTGAPEKSKTSRKSPKMDFSELCFLQCTSFTLLIVVHFWGAVFFLGGVGGLWCYFCVVVIASGLFSQWICWCFGGEHGLFYGVFVVEWWCCLVFFSRCAAAWFDQTCVWGPKATKPNNLQHNLSSTENHMTQPFTPHRLPQFTRRCKHRQTRTLNQLRHKSSETQTLSQIREVHSNPQILDKQSPQQPPKQVKDKRNAPTTSNNSIHHKQNKQANLSPIPNL